jgi:hypothetical protein
MKPVSMLFMYNQDPRDLLMIILLTQLLQYIMFAGKRDIVHSISKYVGYKKASIILRIICAVNCLFVYMSFSSILSQLQ